MVIRSSRNATASRARFGYQMGDLYTDREGPRHAAASLPQLRITSWDRSRAFYVDGLGFKVDWEHRFKPGFPVFTQVSRDGLCLVRT